MFPRAVHSYVLQTARKESEISSTPLLMEKSRPNSKPRVGVMLSPWSSTARRNTAKHWRCKALISHVSSNRPDHSAPYPSASRSPQTLPHSFPSRARVHPHPIPSSRRPLCAAAGPSAGDAPSPRRMERAARRRCGPADRSPARARRGPLNPPPLGARAAGFARILLHSRLLSPREQPSAESNAAGAAAAAARARARQNKRAAKPGEGAARRGEQGEEGRTRRGCAQRAHCGPGCWGA